MAYGMIARGARKGRLVIQTAHAVLPFAVFGLLAVFGCIGRPIIGIRAVDRYGAAIEPERGVSVGCLDAQPRLIVHGGVGDDPAYDPSLTVHLRNPERSGAVATVVIDSVRLQSRLFQLRPVVVQVPRGASLGTLVLQPGESARLVFEYAGEWPAGYSHYEIPAAERLVIRISGVECDGDVIPARLLYYEPEH